MKKISIALFALIFLFIGSCKKVVDGINVDPNRPTDIGPYPLLLNGTEVSTILLFEGSLARLAGMWAGTFTGNDRQYTSLYNYTTTSGDYDDNWDRLYGIVIANAQLTEKKATEVNDKITVGIAQVIEGMSFGLAADVWGDVPFTEAGDPVTYPQPKFDNQLDVYAGVQTILDNAITNLESGVGNGPSGNDFFFGGDPDSWVAVAHTLKARFYLHTKEYAKVLAEAAMGIADPSGNLLAPHGESYLSDFNIYYSFLTYDRAAYMNASVSYAADLLDPSRPTYHGNAKTDEGDRFNYLFLEGLNTADLDPNVQVAFDWGNDASEDGFFGANSSFPLVTFEENQLILAEANMKQAAPDQAAALAALNALRAYYSVGGNTTSGSTVSNGAYVAEGQKYDPYALTDFAAGGINNKAGETADQALLREILTERYLTLIGQIEQWTDVRRTHNYLKIPPVKGTEIPQRFFYAQSEINTNPNTPDLPASDLFTPTTINSTPY